MISHTNKLKEFNRSLKKYFNLFVSSIEGVSDQNIKERIVRTTLTRMIFLWFLEEKGLLQGDYKVLITKYSMNPARFLLENNNRPKIHDHRLRDILYYLPEIISYLIPPIPEEQRYFRTLVFSPDVIQGFFTFLSSNSWDLNEKSDNPNVLTPIVLEFLCGENKPDKKRGVVYTPSFITKKMCQSSIVQFLNTHIKNEVNTSQYTSFVDILKEKNPLYQKLIIDILTKIRVVDPACGSGRFIIEMLFQIETILRTLIKKSNSSLKTSMENEIRDNIVRKNLFGVDISPEHLQVVKMRLFLALIVNRSLDDEIPSFTCLNYQVRCGNSVCGLSKVSSALGKKIISQESSTKTRLTQLMLEKLSLPNEIEDILLFNDKFNPFHWHLEFSEVISKGGFDVVLGNPPYVRADLQDDYYQEFRKIIEYLYATLYEKWDIFIAFIEMGINVLKPNGILSYIVSDSICTSKSASKVRQLLLSSTQVKEIAFFPKIQIFENINVGSVIFTILNQKPRIDQKIVRLTFENPKSSHHVLELDELEFIEEIFPVQFYGELVFRHDIQPKRSYRNTIALGDICYISKGMVLHSEERKYRGEFKKNDLIKDSQEEWTRLYVENKWIERFIITRIKYLEYGTERVPERVSRPTFPDLYKFPKILVGKMGGRAVKDDQGLLCNDSLIVVVPYHFLQQQHIRARVLHRKKNREAISRGSLISPNFHLGYLLAIINSNLARKFLNNIRRHRMKDYVDPNDLKKLPIYSGSIVEQEEIVRIVEKIENNRKERLSVSDTPQLNDLDNEFEFLFHSLNNRIKSIYQELEK